MYVCVPRVCQELREAKGVGASVSGVTGGCEPPFLYWELNLGSLKEDHHLSSFLSFNPTQYSERKMM